MFVVLKLQIDPIPREAQPQMRNYNNPTFGPNRG